MCQEIFDMILHQFSEELFDSNYEEVDETNEETIDDRITNTEDDVSSKSTKECEKSALKVF